VLKRFLLLVTFLFVVMVGFITFRFGSALSQEGNPLPILTSIYKLDFSNSHFVQYSKTDKGNRYISENSGESRFDVTKDFMKKKGWSFKEQIGSGLVFEKSGLNIVVETRQFSRHYILWDIPNEALS
jgi:hypothetical protein